MKVHGLHDDMIYKWLLNNGLFLQLTYLHKLNVQ